MIAHGRARLAAWMFVAVVAMLPALALASTSYYGANYSYDTSSCKTMVSCDGEADGNPAYAIFNTVSVGTGLRVTDSNGSASGCGARYVLSPITFHKTCEDRSFSPDVCGAWKSTNA